MKKKTKRKVLSATGYLLKGMGKLIAALVIYPAKGLYYGFYYGFKYSSQGVQKLLRKRKEKQALAETQKKRPTAGPILKPLVNVRTKKGEFSSFEKKLTWQKSTIGIILGARGTGKTALGMRLLENAAAMKETDEIKKGAAGTKMVYALGFKEEDLPPWITAIKAVDELQNNAVLLVDEGGIQFSSRRAMSTANKLLSDIILIARHKDLSVMFIAQNSANLEINAIRQADYLLLKPSSLLQKDFERKKIKEMYEEVEKDFVELAATEGLVYIYADTYQGFAKNALPSFWNEKVSKGYRA